MRDAHRHHRHHRHHLHHHRSSLLPWNNGSTSRPSPLSPSSHAIMAPCSLHEFPSACSSPYQRATARDRTDAPVRCACARTQRNEERCPNASIMATWQRALRLESPRGRHRNTHARPSCSVWSFDSSLGSPPRYPLRSTSLVSSSQTVAVAGSHHRVGQDPWRSLAPSSCPIPSPSRACISSVHARSLTAPTNTVVHRTAGWRSGSSTRPSNPSKPSRRAPQRQMTSNG